MGPDLAVQIAIRQRLITSPEMQTFADASRILDRISRPITRPAIVVGDATVADESQSIARNRWRVMHDVHVWLKDTSRETVKQCCHAIASAIRTERLDLEELYHCIDVRIAAIRTMADPDGETAHGVVSIDVQVQEV